jgi:hypothetical protein
MIDSMSASSMSNAAVVKPEWTALIRRVREVASGGIESRFMPITVAATQP